MGSNRRNLNLDTGANASAEEADEEAEDADRKVIDIVESFRLDETFYDKKSLKAYLNGACPTLPAHFRFLPVRIR